MQHKHQNHISFLKSVDDNKLWKRQDIEAKLVNYFHSLLTNPHPNKWGGNKENHQIPSLVGPEQNEALIWKITLGKLAHYWRGIPINGRKIKKLCFKLQSFPPSILLSWLLLPNPTEEKKKLTPYYPIMPHCIIPWQIHSNSRCTKRWEIWSLLALGRSRVKMDLGWFNFPFKLNRLYSTWIPEANTMDSPYHGSYYFLSLSHYNISTILSWRAALRHNQWSKRQLDVLKSISISKMCGTIFSLWCQLTKGWYLITKLLVQLFHIQLWITLLSPSLLFRAWWVWLTFLH